MGQIVKVSRRKILSAIREEIEINEMKSCSDKTNLYQKQKFWGVVAAQPKANRINNLFKKRGWENLDAEVIIGGEPVVASIIIKFHYSHYC